MRKRYVKKVEDEQHMQEGLRGVEKKQLPHMLCVTNMLLHGHSTIRWIDLRTMQTSDVPDSDNLVYRFRNNISIRSVMAMRPILWPAPPVCIST
jgi:hypothetical protein